MTANKKQIDKSNPSTEQHKGEHTLFTGTKKALVGGILAGAIALGGQWLVGQVYSGYKARQLLESVASSSLYLGSAIVTASATIIALMLTMLSLTKQSDDGEFDSVFFRQIQRIATLSTIALSAGILLLLFLSVPLQESDQVPARWFTIIYYVLITFVAGLSGLTVGIVLMLLNAINSLIDVVRPSADADVENAENREAAESNAEREKIDKE